MSLLRKSKAKKREFSKSLLLQESFLIWIHSLAHIVLAFYCIYKGYTGTLPWLAAEASLPWTAYAVSQAFYYNKSTKENTRNGIVFETALKEKEKIDSTPDVFGPM